MNDDSQTKQEKHNPKRGKLRIAQTPNQFYLGWRKEDECNKKERMNVMFCMVA